MLLWLSLALARPPTNAPLLLDVLTDELKHATDVFGAQDETPHYVALTATDVHTMRVSARGGTTLDRTDEHERYLDVDLRVGTPTLDSTHPLRGFSSLERDTRRPLRVPTDDGYAFEHQLRTELDRRYREAREHIIVLRANQNVLVEEEERADDFEPREPVSDPLVIDGLDVDLDAWEAVLEQASAPLAARPHVYGHNLSLVVTRTAKHFVDTEGARLRHGRTHARLSLVLNTTAEDGDEVDVFDAIDVTDASDLPQTLEAFVLRNAERLEALRAAPRGEPYSGPVLLSGRAAGVFFHEVLGHRVEGHRQKREDEGQTFADHVGERILPPFIDVVDDPTLTEVGGIELNGHYRYDDEGVAAQPAVLVEDGIFAGFLMGRSPLADVPHSNGHGRRSVGNAPVSRMGNTMVVASETQSMDALRTRMKKLLAEQGLAYGYLVEDIAGGFALTGRMMPNAFNIRAVASWRIYADGRPDELVRGIDLVGTPFVAFSNLIAAGDTPEVFNGTCGAESGWVPVSAVAPPLLFERLEFQLKEKGQDRPPLLDKPLPAEGSPR